jgi:serine/threonine protein kinase
MVKGENPMLAPDALLQNRYLVLRPIGKGGMGAVYLARDQRLGNTIALKETFFEDERLRKAFEREARLLASLRHPALPRVMDHFAEEGGQFLVMEFIPGEDLEEMFKERSGPFPLSDVMKWGDQLLDALDYLHTQEPPIIHRDIKPQNLKLAARGQIILLDFGLAKGSAAGMTKTNASDSIFGYTPTYAPLEQVHGTGTDPRSDLYSLAATLYHLLTAATPPDALARASAVLGGRPDPLRPAQELNPQVPLAVAAVLQQAMALHGDQRPATAAEMRRMLGEASLAVAPAMSKGDQATVIIQPQADAVSVKADNIAGGSEATILDAPQRSDAKQNGAAAKASAATVIEEEKRAPEPKETPANEKPANERLVAASAAATATAAASATPLTQSVSRPAPSPGSNRLIFVAGGVVLLLIAGIVIYAMTGGFSSETPVQEANKATVANQNNAAPAEARKEASPQPPKPQAQATPATGTGAATDRRTVLHKLDANPNPPIQERRKVRGKRG